MWFLVAALAAPVYVIGEPVPLEVAWPHERAGWLVVEAARGDAPVPDSWLRNVTPFGPDCFGDAGTLELSRCLYLGEPGTYTIRVGVNTEEGVLVPVSTTTFRLRSPTRRARAQHLATLDGSALRLATPPYVADLLVIAREPDPTRAHDALELLAQVPAVSATDALLALGADPAHRLDVLEALCARAPPVPSPMAPDFLREDQRWFQDRAWTPERVQAARALADVALARPQSTEERRLAEGLLARLEPVR